ncbi:DUF6157 family protein [Bradyrhizobium sp. USDA 4350]
MAKPLYSTNCFNTLIRVAEDCPAQCGEEPQPRGGQPTVAVLQFRMIAGAPYKYTSDDVVFATSSAGRALDAKAAKKGAQPRPRDVLLARPGLHARLAARQAVRLGRSRRRRGPHSDLRRRQQALPGAGPRPGDRADARDAVEASVTLFILPWRGRIDANEVSGEVG